jgi:hypothetical protein
MSEKIPNENMDLIWKTRMEILMKKKRIIETKEIIDKSIWDWYFERGMQVPNWRMNKDPQWWVEYLNEIDGKNDIIDDTL